MMVCISTTAQTNTQTVFDYVHLLRSTHCHPHHEQSNKLQCKATSVEPNHHDALVLSLGQAKQCRCTWAATSVCVFGATTFLLSSLFPPSHAPLRSAPYSRFPSSPRYDTIDEFNVVSKAECDQPNLAYVKETNIKRRD